MNTLIDVAIADGHFKTLAKALKAAGLVDTLKGAGPFTVFAPTDDAFAKLPSGTLETARRRRPCAAARRQVARHVAFISKSMNTRQQ